MPIQVKLRRGDSAKNELYAGVEGEVTVDLEEKKLILHDGVTPGGIAIPNQDQVISMSGSSIGNVYIDGDYLDNWGDKTDERYATMTAIINGKKFSSRIKMKPQGTSSLAYPKKNFTINLYTDDTYGTKMNVEAKSGWGEHSKYVLKADYIDPTHSCNVVSARIAGKANQKYGILPDSPNGGPIDGFPVLLHMNGASYGLYNWTIPKDGWMCGFNDSNTAMIVGAEVQINSGAFRSTITAFDDTGWSSEYGKSDAAAIEAFNRLITFVKDSNDADFRANFEDYINLDAALNYYAIAYMSAAVDNLGKNMLMATSDRLVWYPILYDLDSLWGVSTDGTYGTNEYTICPDWYNCSTSLLWEKLSRCFANEFANRYEELRADILSMSGIISEFEQYIGKIPKELYTEDATIWTGLSSMVRTLNGMRAWIPVRIQNIDYRIEDLRTVGGGNPGRKIYELPQPWVTTGGGVVNNTHTPLFDNKYRDWTLFLKMPNDNLTVGYRVIASCYIGEEEGLVIKREYTDNNELYLRLGDKQVVRAASSSNPSSVIAIVKNKTAYYCYRDGVLVGTIGASDLAQAYVGPLYLGGGGNAAGTETWWGDTPMTISNVVIYRKALGKANVAAVTASLA